MFKELRIRSFIYIFFILICIPQALLAIVESITCPDEPEVPSDSYLSSNDIDLGIIDM